MSACGEEHFDLGRVRPSPLLRTEPARIAAKEGVDYAPSGRTTRMKKRPAASIAVLMAVWLCQRQPVSAGQSELDSTGFVARTYNAGAQAMPYRLFVPKDYDRARQYPLIVWLHGASGMGTDNLQQISGDQVFGTRLWVRSENQAAHPAFVVAPQSARAWQIDAALPDLQPDVRVVAALLDTLEEEFPIDRKRVYVIGQSAGGVAAWNLATNQPERLAAVVLVCPALHEVSRSSQAATLPLWVFQGDKDGLIRATRDLIAAVQKNGGHPQFTVYPNEGHEIWTRAFAEPGLVEWLFGQRRP